MKIQRRHVGVGTALLALGVAVGMGPGCADNNSSIFVRSALAVPTDTCTVSADSSSTVISRGTLDTAFTTEYHAVLLVGNQLVRRGNTATLRTETSRVTFYEADVRVVDGATNNELTAFSVPITGFVDPGSGTEPGYGLASVVLIDSASAQAAVGAFSANDQTVVASKELIANVIIRGQTLGGVEVETGEWPFPIDVCRGCLIVFPGEADDPTTTNNLCDFREDAQTNCRPGLDSFVDCRFCAGSLPICQFPITP